MTPDAQLPGAPVPFGSYLLDALIAEGGMARVYKARLRGLGGFEKVLVVKQIRPALASDPRFVSMFVEEAKTLVQLGHPHIVPVYELGIVEGVYFLAMEHVDGATLEELVAIAPLAPALAAHLGAQVADALHYAHVRFGLVHRDVTPRNVLVDAAGHARLVDFGIAAPAEGSGEGVPSFGSPGYMAPEQMRGERIGPAADVFALGAALHFALSGAHAFVRDGYGATRRAVLDEPPPALAEGHAPANLRALVEACLARDPSARPGSAGELSGKLRAFVASERPEGVAEELGALAESAMKRRARRVEHASRPRPLRPTPAATGPGPSGSVRTLATSAALEALLRSSQRPPEVDGGTRPLPRTTPILEEADLADAGAGSEPRDVAARAKRRPPLGGVVAFAVAMALGAAVALSVRPPATADERPPREPDPRTLAAAAESVSASASVSVSASDSDSASDPASASDSAPDSASDSASDPDSDSASDPDSVSASDSASPSSAARAGTLTIHAAPWATVRIDGRDLGSTPRRGESVSAGVHALVFDCPPLGRSARTVVRVGPGESVRVFADLSVDPPRVSVR